MQLELFMPFYGNVEHFKYAVNSILCQSDSDWKLTIIDDLYPSNQPQQYIFSINDPRITYVRNEVNLGVNRNFQQCIDKARADFITIIGCDDALLPNYVQRMKEIISAEPNVSFIQPGVIVIDEENKEYLPVGDKVKQKLFQSFSPPSIQSGDNLAASLLKGCWTYFPSIAWKTSKIKTHNFRTDFQVALDLALELEIIVDGGEIFIDRTPTFAYRRHRQSVSMKTALDGTRFLEESKLFEEIAVKVAILGWTESSKAAKLHLTSRLNAAKELPRSFFSGHLDGTKVLIRHIFGK